MYYVCILSAYNVFLAISSSDSFIVHIVNRFYFFDESKKKRRLTAKSLPEVGRAEEIE